MSLVIMIFIFISIYETTFLVFDVGIFKVAFSRVTNKV